MSANAPERTESDCTCGGHDDDGCPKEVVVEVPTPMSAELIKASYLQLQVSDERTEQPSLLPTTSSPILHNLGSLFPLLSNEGLYEWAKYVFSNLKEWDIPQTRGKVVTRWVNEIDKRYPVPTSRSETREVLKARDGLGCVCRRPRPDCRFQRDSHYVLEDYEIAHLMPVSQGGRDIWSNLALISPSCNKSQGSKEFGVWLHRQTGRKHLHWRLWSPDRPTSSSARDMIAAVSFQWRPDETE